MDMLFKIWIGLLVVGMVGVLVGANTGSVGLAAVGVLVLGIVTVIGIAAAIGLCLED